MSSMHTSEFSTFERSSGDIVYLKPCLDVACYWAGSAFDRIEGILDFYSKSLGLIAESLTFYRTETMNVSRRLKKDTLDLIPFWLTGTKTRRDIYMLNLESGRSADDISDRAFAFAAIEATEEATGFIRLVLPVDTFARDWNEFYSIAKSLLDKIDFAFGSAGFSLNWNDLADTADMVREDMSGMSKRYPGLDLADPSATKYSAASGFKCVNWLTFLGNELAEKVGGAAALGKDVGAGVAVEALPRGLVVRAGAAPDIGDTNRRRGVPLYHQTGRALVALRARAHPPFLGVDGVVDDDITNEWLARFDS